MEIGIRLIEHCAKYARACGRLFSKPQILDYKIPKLNSDILEFNRCIPEYLIHLTSSNNYNRILQQGLIKPTQTPMGIYCIEANNFLSKWNQLRINNNSTTVQNELIKYISRNSDGIVVLKIPTAKLKKASDIKIRSQNFIYQREIDPRKDPILMNHLIDGTNIGFANSYIQQGHAIEYIIPEEVPFSSVEFVGKIKTNSNYNDTIEQLKQLLL